MSKLLTASVMWYFHRLLMQLPYIDDRRLILFGKVTVFGSSESVGSHMHLFFEHFCVFPPQAFGGYLTLKMLAATDKLFQCAAAAAPITDFRLYSKYSLWNWLLQDSRPHCMLHAIILYFHPRCCIFREVSGLSSQRGTCLLGEAFRLKLFSELF